MKTLLGQANNRKSKKDRKKEIRQMEDRYQELEQKLNDLKRNSRGSTLSGGTRFYGDSPGEWGGWEGGREGPTPPYSLSQSPPISVPPLQVRPLSRGGGVALREGPA